MPDALETLVSSRIRRTLLEHLLSHPKDRFYLRGLAKELNLSVSPLRRELKRLERAGALKAAPEGNMLFYEVNASAPILQQVRQAMAPATSAAAAPVAQVVPQLPVAGAAPVPTPQPTSSVDPFGRFAVIAASGALLGILLLVTSLAYVSWKKPQAVGRVIRALDGRSEVTVVAPAASGMMRGARWRLVPGGFGGFGGAGGPASETY